MAPPSSLCSRWTAHPAHPIHRSAPMLRMHTPLPPMRVAPRTLRSRMVPRVPMVLRAMPPPACTAATRSAATRPRDHLPIRLPPRACQAVNARPRPTATTGPSCVETPGRFAPRRQRLPTALLAERRPGSCAAAATALLAPGAPTVRMPALPALGAPTTVTQEWPCAAPSATSRMARPATARCIATRGCAARAWSTRRVRRRPNRATWGR